MVTIYTKDYCPYCVKAKSLMNSIWATYEEIDITHDSDTFMKIYEKSHMRTVPQIFVWETCLGGYDNIATLHEKWELALRLGL